MAKRGRPKLANRRSHLYGVRFCDDEREHVDAILKGSGLNLDQLVRTLVRSVTVDEIKVRVGR
jgi:hypothetical protein